MLDSHAVIDESISICKGLQAGWQFRLGPLPQGLDVLPFRQDVIPGRLPPEHGKDPFAAGFQEDDAHRVRDDRWHRDDDALRRMHPQGNPPGTRALPQGHRPEDRVDMVFFLHGAKILFSKVIPNPDYGLNPWVARTRGESGLRFWSIITVPDHQPPRVSGSAWTGSSAPQGIPGGPTVLLSWRAESGIGLPGSAPLFPFPRPAGNESVSRHGSGADNLR